MSLPVDWFSPSLAGGLIQTIMPGAGYLTKNVLLASAPMLRGVLAPTIVLAVAAVVDWRPALVMLLAAPLLWLVHRHCARVIDRSEQRSHQAHGEAIARIIEFAEAQPTLRASGSGGFGMRLLSTALDEQERAVRADVSRELAARAGFGVAVNLTVAVLVATIAWLLLRDPGEAVLLVALLVLVLRFAEPITTVADMSRTLRQARGAIQRTAEIFAADPLPVPTRPRELAGDRLDVALRAVRFRFPSGGPDGPWTLDGIDLTVPAGTTTALVGPSGAGKSAVLRLLARFTDPDEGRVLIGGIDIRDVELAALYAAVGVLLQDVVLAEGTIRDNVLLGRPDAGERQLAEAAGLAGLDEVVQRLPQGWDSPVGSRGSALSGGERQRVSLARIALQDPPVILLDEATAALDPVNERIVSSWIQAMSGRRTLVVVAHQLHTIAAADRIVVLDGGCVVEQGDHEALLTADSGYARTWRLRTQAAG